MKQLKILLLGFIFILLQITALNLLTIHGIKPDFVVLFVIVQSLRDGPVAGVLWGFSLGLILDTITGGLTGLGALAYSLTGFICGKIGQGKTFTPIRYLRSVGIGITISYAILTYFLQPWDQVSWLTLLVTNTIPGIMYTWFFVLIWVYSPFTNFQTGKDRA